MSYHLSLSFSKKQGFTLNKIALGIKLYNSYLAIGADFQPCVAKTGKCKAYLDDKILTNIDLHQAIR